MQKNLKGDKELIATKLNKICNEYQDKKKKKRRTKQLTVIKHF